MENKDFEEGRTEQESYTAADNALDTFLEFAKRYWRDYRAVSIVVLIVIGVVTAPIWSSLLGTIAAIIGTILSFVLLIALVGIVGVVGGAISIVSATTFLISGGKSLGFILVLMGYGFFSVAIGLLAMLATVWFCWKYIPYLVAKCKEWIKRGIGRIKGEHYEEGN